MFYKHQYFTINLDTKKVFDINSKELHITGNAYRVLVFLCENRSGTITAIGECLDWAKDYDENHLRQYRYKIETLIGRKIIEYRNNIYTLVGDIEKVEELAENKRNTVLLHPNDIKSGDNKLIVSPITKKIAYLSVLSAITLSLLAFFYWSPPVKKSMEGICHERSTTYYSKTRKFTRFTNIEECLQNGGRLPKNKK